MNLKKITENATAKSSSKSAKSLAVKKVKKVLIFCAVAVFFFILILLVTNKKTVEQKVATLPVVVIQKPVRQNLVESISISGYIEAKSMIPVVPFVSGTITEYPVSVGDYVEKNQLLAKIDDKPFRQQMIQAEAAYFAAKSTYDRVESLYKAGATTQQNYDTTRAQYDANKAQYDLAKLQLGYTEVCSPISGTVLVADQAVGDIGNQQSPVAIVADLNNLVVRLKVPEKYFDLFVSEKENLSVKITRPAEKNLFEDAVSPAIIENIAPYVSPQNKTFEVVCRLTQNSERFKPGMFVKVQIAYKTYENVPVIPLNAKKMDGSFYIYDEESQTVHFQMPDEKTSISSVNDGINFIVDEQFADSYFVIDGQNFVFDGQKVRLFDEALKEHNLE
ncbi:MAG: efflux RND transporter periplasmic adaptor subunit [Spirochaetia bacterium]|nr:efflux RND transporter periplasmic adaptor subunit [Spirochaetia bacterium]